MFEILYVAFLTTQARCRVGADGLSRLDRPVSLHEHGTPADGQVPAGQQRRRLCEVSVFVCLNTTTVHPLPLEGFLTSSSLVRREPLSGFTPLMEAAASGHEIIVQCLLDHVSGLSAKTTNLSRVAVYSVMSRFSGGSV